MIDPVRPSRSRPTSSARLRLTALALLVLLAAGSSLFAATPPPYLAQLRAQYGIRPDNIKLVVYRMAADDADIIPRAIRDAVRGYLDSPETLEVDLGPIDPAGLRQGSFRCFRLTMTNGRFEQILINRAYIEVDKPVLDLAELLLHDRIRFKSSGKIEFLVESTEAEVNRLIFSSKNLPLRNPRIELRDGSIRFSAKVHSAIGWTNVRVDGAFRVMNGTQIHLLPTGLKVSILPLPGFVAREVFQRLNPIADLAKLQVKASPDLILSRPGRLLILTNGMKSRVEASRR